MSYHVKLQPHHGLWGNHQLAWVEYKTGPRLANADILYTTNTEPQHRLVWEAPASMGMSTRLGMRLANEVLHY